MNSNAQHANNAGRAKRRKLDGSLVATNANNAKRKLNFDNDQNSVITIEGLLAKIDRLESEVNLLRLEHTRGPDVKAWPSGVIPSYIS